MCLLYQYFIKMINISIFSSLLNTFYFQSLIVRIIMDLFRPTYKKLAGKILEGWKLACQKFLQNCKNNYVGDWLFHCSVRKKLFLKRTV